MPPTVSERQSFPATENDRGKRLDVFLAERLPEMSRSRIQELIRREKVSLEELRSPQALKPGYRLRGVERIGVEWEPPAPLRAHPEPLPLEILYEDADVVAVNKPAGMVVHIGAGVRHGTLVNALLHRFQTLSGTGGPFRPGIVHRLDRNTSGVLLVAKNDFAHQQLAAQFAGRTIEKRYLALVHGAVSKNEETVSAPISRDLLRRTRMTTRRRQGRAAVSRYRVVQRFRGFTLLEVEIFTGRTHQVRVHLSSIGHPVVGDMLYGAPGTLAAELFQEPPAPAQEILTPRPVSSAKRKKTAGASEKTLPTLSRNFLHAASICFRHPRTGTPVTIQSPLPKELQEFLGRLLPT